jgi:hypothetical protein
VPDELLLELVVVLLLLELWELLVVLLLVVVSPPLPVAVAAPPLPPEPLVVLLLPPPHAAATRVRPAVTVMGSARIRVRVAEPGGAERERCVRSGESKKRHSGWRAVTKIVSRIGEDCGVSRRGARHAWCNMTRA